MRSSGRKTAPSPKCGPGLNIQSGSSSGYSALPRCAIAALPSGLQATLLILLHISPTHASLFPAALSRAGPLPAEHGRNGMRIERGRIYVAAPDHHMTVGPIGFIRLDQGPKENHTRPA